VNFKRAADCGASAWLAIWRRVWLSLGIAAIACETVPPTPLDVIGAPETVIETKHEEQLSDKHPVFDPDLTVVEEFDGCSMRLNKSASVTRLTVKDLEGGAAALQDYIFPTRAAALMALGSRPVIPSMEVVNGALKPFNDGLYASVERMAEYGEHGSPVDKRATFEALLTAMLQRATSGDAEADVAAALFAGAARLAGVSPALPDAIEARANAALEAFDRDVLDATPIGFYTWSAELSSIFRRDRFLQSALPRGRVGLGPAVAVSRALAADSGLSARYRGVLDLQRGLTNPLLDFDPLALLESVGNVSSEQLAAAEALFVQEHPELDAQAPCQAGFSWLPASESPERKLIASQWCHGSRPSNLLDALIAAIQSGAIDLTPSATSGWYDWQLYALETLLLPERGSESQHLLLTQKYRDKLVDTFKSLLIQTRETHVKQLGTVAVPASATLPPHYIDVFPLLPVEPFPTFYLRTGRGYVFLRNLLKASLGERALQEGRRLLEDGSEEEQSLSDELEAKIQWLYGLHLVAAASIGMRDEIRDDERAQLDLAAAERAARDWLASWRDDHDVLLDPRVAVPLVSDGDRRTTTNLAVVGVKVIAISARFPEGYEPEVSQQGIGWAERRCVVRGFCAFEPYMLVEQTLQFDRATDLPPLTRDELRALLDGKHSLAQMRAALGAR
jgi:hypothetical protein